jgi:hypothetical protein
MVASDVLGTVSRRSGTHDLTLTTRNSSETFYARGGRWSFDTAKTRTRRRQQT